MLQRMAHKFGQRLARYLDRRAGMHLNFSVTPTPDTGFDCRQLYQYEDIPEEPQSIAMVVGSE